MLEQIWEDLDASDPQPMPWALNDPARVASGTLDGLAVMQGLTANGQTLGQFLTNFFSQPANANVAILVTGHSLGGCLATIVATWIRVLLPNFRGAIQPITFAAPTAGNEEFATLLRRAVSNGAAVSELARRHPARLLRPRRHRQHLRGQHAGYAGHRLARRARHGSGARHHGGELRAARRKASRSCPARSFSTTRRTGTRRRCTSIISRPTWRC